MYQRQFGSENPLKFDCVTFMTLAIRHRFREVSDWFPQEEETYRLPADLQLAHWYGNAPQQPDQAAMQHDEAADLDDLADVTRPFGSERWHDLDRLPLADRLAALKLFYDDLTCDLQSLRQRLKPGELENYTGHDGLAGELKKLVRYRQRVARKIDRVRGTIDKQEKLRLQAQAQRERLRVVWEMSGRAREEKQASAEWRRHLELLAYLAEAKAKSDHYANIPVRRMPRAVVTEDESEPVVVEARPLAGKPRVVKSQPPARTPCAPRATKTPAGLWFQPITTDNLQTAVEAARRIFPYATRADGFGPELAYRAAMTGTDPRCRYYLAWLGPVLIGLTGHYPPEYWAPLVSLGWLGVLPEHRCKGHGEKILRETARLVTRLGIRELTLYSHDRAEERDAQRLFLRVGFQVVGPGWIQDVPVRYFSVRLPLNSKAEAPVSVQHMALFRDIDPYLLNRLTLCLGLEKMCCRHDIRRHGCHGLPLCILPMPPQAVELARTFWDAPAMLHYESPFDVGIHGSIHHARLFSDLYRMGVDAAGVKAMLKAANAAGGRVNNYAKDQSGDPSTQG